MNSTERLVEYRSVPELQVAGGAHLHYDDEGAGPLVLLVEAVA